MPEEDVFKLVGILERVPAFLIAEQPFVGFIQPYGVCVRFYTPEGELVEECALSSFHRREAVLSLHAETTQGGKENRTIADLFKDLTVRTHSKILKEYEENPQSQLSILETAATDLWLQGGISLEVLGTPVIERTVSGVRRSLFTMREKILTGKQFTVNFTAKIGVDEARQYIKTLKFLPMKLLRNVKIVRKKQSPNVDIESLMAGVTTEGYYIAKDQSITMLETSRENYPDMSAKRKARRSHALVHEVGESVWDELSDAERQKWTAISWPASKRRRLDKHFLTQYSYYVNERDDYSEHFALYILHGPEFREAAAAAGPLKKKYAFIRKMIHARFGVPVEYPKIIPWTIEQIHGALRQEARKQMELEEAWLEEVRYGEKLGEDQREHIYDDVRQSFEQLIEEEERRDDLETMEDDVDRSVAEAECDDDEIRYPTKIEVKEGIMNYHDIAVHLLEALRGALEIEDDALKIIRDKIFPFLLEGDWEGIQDILKVYSESSGELHDLLRQIRAIDRKPETL